MIQLDWIDPGKPEPGPDWADWLLLALVWLAFLGALVNLVIVAI